MAIGPVVAHEDFADPLAAFGGIQDIAARAPEKLAEVAVEIGIRYRQHRERTGLNHSETCKFLSSNNLSQPNSSTQALLESFPSEFGIAGRTVWAVVFQNDSDLSLSVNFTEAALLAAGPQSYVVQPLPDSGWAFSTFSLNEAATVLIRCNEVFMLGSLPVSFTPDAYDDGRAVHVFHLQAGKHRIFVRFQQPTFTCDIFKDSAATRANITGVLEQATEGSPLVALADKMISDVVEGYLP
jgi:hypothetical protein